MAMGRNVAQKLIASHLVDGEMTAGAEIVLRMDQTLTQDATGTMVMLELEALGSGHHFGFKFVQEFLCDVL